MNEQEEFLKKMERLQVPDIDPHDHAGKTKMAIMNAQRSVALGVWLIMVPAYFLLCVCMYYSFHTKMGWFGSMYTLISSLDKNKYIDFLAPIILLVMPIVCIVINALAITHVHVEQLSSGSKKGREFGITIKIRPWNILLILAAIIIIGAFMSYVLAQNISIQK